MSSRAYNLEKTINKIRNLTPNHPGYQVERKKTHTQRQWEYQMKYQSHKENLRKKSTRLSNKEEEIVETFADFDKILQEETQKKFHKKWSRLSKLSKIDRLMDYYDKSKEEIMKILDKIEDKKVEYNETEGKINKINIDNIFEDE